MELLCIYINFTCIIMYIESLLRSVCARRYHNQGIVNFCTKIIKLRSQSRDVTSEKCWPIDKGDECTNDAYL